MKLKRRNNPKTKMIIFAVLICTMTFGLAIIRSALAIKSTSQVSSANWNIELKDLMVKKDSVESTTPPTITDGNKINFDVTLDMPGKYFVVYANVYNSGTIDAILDNVNITFTPALTDAQKKAIKYSISYKDGTPIRTDDALHAGDRMPIRILFEYNPDITESDLLTSDVTLTGSCAINYTPDDGTANEVKLNRDAQGLIDIANESSVTDYNATEAKKEEMFTFSHNATEQLGANTDYRYIGKEPNNYIKFNDETWRIIGVFEVPDEDGTVRKRIKIIKDERILNTAIMYDGKLNVGSSGDASHPSASWADAQLMYMLNPDAHKYFYYDGYTIVDNTVFDKYNYPIYKFGYLPAKVSETDTVYPGTTANTWSLNSVAARQIDAAKYYLGSDGVSINTSGIKAETMYDKERKNSQTPTHAASWVGKLALMYPSDYIYTFANGVSTKCFTDAYNCENGTPATSWIYRGSSNSYGTSSYTEFLLYELKQSSRTSGRFLSKINSNGWTGTEDLYDYTTKSVRPVAYLNPEVFLSGTGTKDDMYEIVAY